MPECYPPEQQPTRRAARPAAIVKPTCEPTKNTAAVNVDPGKAKIRLQFGPSPGEGDGPLLKYSGGPCPNRTPVASETAIVADFVLLKPTEAPLHKLPCVEEGQAVLAQRQRYPVEGFRPVAAHIPAEGEHRCPRVHIPTSFNRHPIRTFPAGVISNTEQMPANPVPEFLKASQASDR